MRIIVGRTGLIHVTSYRPDGLPLVYGDWFTWMQHHAGEHVSAVVYDGDPVFTGGAEDLIDWDRA